jgi:tetrapyrrole methylase family protein / MazG family protein
MDLDKLHTEFDRLIKVMEILRSPNGCPWDKKQDYYSLAPCIIEEAYEVVESLQKDDLNLLKEELGDLLLQVIFEAQIGREEGDFNLIDVIVSISNKLIRRHPHVFGNKKAETISDVMLTWEGIKEEERLSKGEKIKTSVLDGLIRSQPALNQAYDIQEKAAQVGFDWDNVKDILAKVEEELSEVKEAIKNSNTKKISDELGDLLFATVNLSRFFDINPEIALLGTILKFKQRFMYIEKKVKELGYEPQDLPLEKLDFYWEESKKELK